MEFPEWKHCGWLCLALSEVRDCLWIRQAMLVHGVVPLRTSMLDPIKALRYE